jgi:integrase
MGTKKTAKSRLTFTKNRLNALPVPDRGRQYHYDTKTAGLCICVTSQGTKTFYAYRWANGRPARIRVGRYPEVTIETARNQVAEINAAIARGEDPQALRVQARQEPTIGKAWLHWLENHARTHKKDEGRQDERKYKAHLKRWQNRKLSAIGRHEVVAWHKRIGEEHGHVAANRVLTLLSSLFNKAADMGYTGVNPTHGVKRFKEHARDRFLQPAELPKFFDALEAEPSDTLRDFFKVALFTGARRSSVQSMRWDDLDLENGTWRIPKGDVKSGEPVTLPLSPPALDVLRRRSEAREGPWVFPSDWRRGWHITEPKHAWRRILKRAGLENLRIHDLRRTLGSWQAATGASLQVIGKSLGHSDRSKATVIYSRLHLDPIRESVNRATDAILAAANGKGGHE